MSGLMAFATGFLNGSVEVQRERAAAEIADKEAKALQLEQGRSAITDLIKSGKASDKQIQAAARMYDMDPTLLSGLGVELNDLNTKTVFGSGENSVVFNWNHSEKGIKDSAQMNLRDFNKTLSNPEIARDYLAKFASNPGAAQQWLQTVDGQMLQYQQDFHFDKSGRNELGVMTPDSAVYTDFSRFGSVVNFADILRMGLGTSGPALDQRVVSGAIQSATKGKGLSETQIMVKTSANTGEQFSSRIMDVSAEEKQFLKQLAQEKGYVDENVMLYNMDKIMYDNSDSISNVNLLLKQTRRLHDAGALKMLGAVGADDTVENAVGDILFDANNGVAPKGNLSTLMSVVLPLIPEPTEFKVEGVTVPPLSGKKFMEARGIDVDDVKKKAEFGRKATELQQIIIDNMTENANGIPSVKVGFAGFMQNLRIGIAGPGGQFSQLFGGLDPTELEEGTSQQTLRDATREVLAKYNIKVTEEYKLGETATAAVQLAYAQARAVDSNGRLSDMDLKIQLDQILASGLFANKNVNLGSLKLLNTQFTRVLEDNVFYAGMVDRDIEPKEAKMFEANIIINRARARHRAKQTVGTNSTSAASGGTYTQQVEGGATFTPATRYVQPDYEFFRGSNGVLFKRNIKDDSMMRVQDPQKFYVATPAGQPAIPAGQPATPAEQPATPAEQPATAPVVVPKQNNSQLIPASRFAGQNLAREGGFTIIDGKKYRMIESKGPSGNLEPFYKEVK